MMVAGRNIIQVVANATMLNANGFMSASLNKRCVNLFFSNLSIMGECFGGAYLKLTLLNEFLLFLLLLL